MRHEVKPICRVLLRGLLDEFGHPAVREAMKRRDVRTLTDVRPVDQWGLLTGLLQELENPKAATPERHPQDVATIDGLHKAVCSIMSDLDAERRRVAHLETQLAMSQRRTWWQIF